VLATRPASNRAVYVASLGGTAECARAVVDGFNLYNGAREIAGAQPGWKWLDIRKLAAALADERWPGGSPNPGARRAGGCHSPGYWAAPVRALSFSWPTLRCTRGRTYTSAGVEIECGGRFLA
jgi:hypothetical protein